MATCYVRANLGFGGDPKLPAGTRKVRAEVINRHFATHSFLRGGIGDFPNRDERELWTLSHRGTGWALATCATKSNAKKLASIVGTVAKVYGVSWDFDDAAITAKWPTEARKEIAAAQRKFNVKEPTYRVSPALGANGR